MNLYKLHAKPEVLANYEDRIKVPAMAWERYSENYDTVPAKELKKLIPYIAKGPMEAVQFAQEVLGFKRFKLGEPAIATNAQASHDYATYVLGKRFKLGEPVLMRDSNYAAWYASDILKKRWKDAEPYIMKDPRSAVRYAIDTIQGKWPEAEPYIKKDKPAWDNYINNFGRD